MSEPTIISVPRELGGIIPFPFRDYALPMHPDQALAHLGTLVKQCSAMSTLTKAAVGNTRESANDPETLYTVVDILDMFLYAACELHTLATNREGGVCQHDAP